jgi:fibronectin type 3 domain-containing protein
MKALIEWTPPTEREDNTAVDPTAVHAFRVYQSDSVDGAYVQIAEVAGNVHAYTTQDLAPGPHYFKVVAVDQSNTFSGFSESASVTVPASVAALKPPSNVTATLVS